MINILITGAGGNVGSEIIRGLREIGTMHRIIAADVKRYFEPFIETMLERGIRKVVFLSVQGVENQKRIPHHQIERLILEKGLEYIFMRPSYFMQNLVTTLAHEIRTRDTIFIPAGNIKFTWVDARDIGLVGAMLLDDFDRFRNHSYVITGSEQMDFREVARLLTEKTGRSIRYESPSLLKFYREKRRQGMQRPMIFVMIMLHYLPRFSKKLNPVTSTVQEITGRPPGTLEEFTERTKSLLYKSRLTRSCEGRSNVIIASPAKGLG